MADDILLSLRGLKKYFRTSGGGVLHANERVDLDIGKGETLGVVGESGSGKSTLGRTVLGLYGATSGEIIYYGKTVFELAPKYVVGILKHPGRILRRAERLKARAERLRRRAGCGADGYKKRREADLCEDIARSEERSVLRLLGGIARLPDPTEGCRLLLKRYLAGVRLLSALRAEKNGKSAHGGGDSIISECERRLSDAERILNEYKKSNRCAEGFSEAESYLTDGVDLARLTKREMRRLRGDIQIIFQDPYSSLNPRMRIYDIIAEGLLATQKIKHGSEDMKERIYDVAERCGVSRSMLSRFPHEFSGGQRQRIAIARALALSPRVVVCDECVSALDVSIRSQIINLLLDLKEERGLTYVFISHDLSVVRFISDRIAVMYLGHIVELAESEELFLNPRHPYTVSLLSAIPTVRRTKERPERILPKGDPPNPASPPEGCPYSEVCFMARDICKRNAPILSEIGAGHYSACHFYSDSFFDSMHQYGDN